MAATPPLPSIPVTVLTGFLGAGKTTLLQYILSANHGHRIAVIENEFGDDIGVEKLVAKSGANGRVLDGFYELRNGCVCCSVRDDLVNTLETLLARRDRFDYILVETTGMADPGPVASIFWVDEELEGRIFLDGIVTLVDAPRLEFHLQHVDTQREVAAQVAYADRILLNKGDLVQELEERERIECRIKGMNGLAGVRWTERARVDLEYILNIKSFSTTRVEPVAKALRAMLHEGDDAEEEGNVSHTGGMQTTCVRVSKGPLDQEKLERWLGELLWQQDAEGNDDTGIAARQQQLFRVKGIVAVANEPFKCILQAVHELFEVYASEERWSEAEVDGTDVRVSQVVFIGVHLSKSELRAGLEACVVAQ